MKRFPPSPRQMPMFYVCCVCNTAVPFIAALRFDPTAEPFNCALHRACLDLQRRSWWWRFPRSDAEAAQ